MTFWEFLQSTLLQNIALIFTCLVIFFYTLETYRLRKATQETNRLTVVPFALVSFNSQEKGVWIFEASGRGVVLNYKVFAKHIVTGNMREIEEGFAMGPKSRHWIKIDFWDNRNEFQYFMEYHDIFKNNYRTTWKPNDPHGLSFEMIK